MARNEEKHYARLNRLLLKQEKEEQEKKNPKRPKLDDLHTYDEVKKWLPSIKCDIDFCLKQSQVPCYPESKIEEYNKKIDYLKRQYSAFIKKLRHLDPEAGSLPWTDRRYGPRKHFHTQDTCTDGSGEKVPKLIKEIGCDSGNSINASPLCSTTADVNSETSAEVTSPVTDPLTAKEEIHKNTATPDFSPISTPILLNESSYQNMYGYSQPSNITTNISVNPELDDKPLSFTKPSCEDKNLQHCYKNKTAEDDSSTCGKGNYSTNSQSNECHIQDSLTTTGTRTTLQESVEKESTKSITTNHCVSDAGLIPYSDSSDSDS